MKQSELLQVLFKDFLEFITFLQFNEGIQKVITETSTNFN